MRHHPFFLLELLSPLAGYSNFSMALSCVQCGSAMVPSRCLRSGGIAHTRRASIPPAARCLSRCVAYARRASTPGAATQAVAASRSLDATTGPGVVTLPVYARRKLLAVPPLMLFAAAAAVAASEPSRPLAAGALDALKDTLASDIAVSQYFITGRLTASVYSPDCVFQDPTTEVHGVKRYTEVTSTLFDQSSSSLELISIAVTGESGVLLTQPTQREKREEKRREKRREEKRREKRGRMSPPFAPHCRLS